MELKLPQLEPTMYPVDATKCKSIKELGLLFNALGLGMSEEYAKDNDLEHLLIKEEE